MSEQAKEAFLAYYKKEVENFMLESDEVKAQYTQALSKPPFAEKRIELHHELFAKADVNKDGLLNLDEWISYNNLSYEVFKSNGVEKIVKTDHTASFDVFRISGKEGISSDDILQAMAWRDEVRAAGKDK